MAAVDDDGFGEPTDDGWGDPEDWGQSPTDSEASEGVFKVHVAQEVKKQLQDDQDFLTYTKLYVYSIRIDPVCILRGSTGERNVQPFFFFFV